MFILFDIGGSKIRLGAVKELNQNGFSETIILPTPPRFENGIKIFKESVFQLSRGNRINSLVGGITGCRDATGRKLFKSPNLPGWENMPLIEELEKAVMSPILFLENDAALGGLGEAVYGAGKSHKIIVYLTIGTGIGGARIVDGKIDKNIFGFEPGHQLIPCFLCGGSGELENHISGRALEKLFGKKPEEIKSEEVWNKITETLCLSLANTIVHWSPDAVVLGGSMMKDISIKKIESGLRKFLKIFPHQPLIKKASLGEFSGLWGAYEFLKSKIGQIA